MNKMNTKYWLVTLIIVLSFSNIFAQTIEQKLSVISNSGQNGGSFVIEYKIKGTDLTDARTLGSLNADIVYDSSLIKFTSASDWNTELLSTNGYEKFVSLNEETDFNRSLRIMVNALNVNADSSNNQPGFNLGIEYTSIVRLNFIILDNTKSITLNFKSSTNQVGIFTNPNNNPNTFEISDLSLSVPVTIDHESLPVMMANFNSVVKADNVTLTWTTTSEQNNAGFKIERKKTDSDKDWVGAGFVKGKGNSNSQTQYIFEDSKLTPGKYNYRMKQIDNNGNFKYYNLSSTIEIGVPAKFNLSQNYPNPFNPTTKINYDLPKDSKVNLTIFDILGREILSLVNQEQKAGYYTVTADSKNLSSGIYFYRLIAKSSEKDYVMTKKMSLVK
jgi:hypothetical protein